LSTILYLRVMSEQKPISEIQNETKLRSVRQSYTSKQRN